jgi:hypothetical protein
MLKPTEYEYNMTANHCEKLIDANDESLWNQRNANITWLRIIAEKNKKNRIDANNENNVKTNGMRI